MARHLRRPVALVMLVVALGVLLGPATTALAHVRPVRATASQEPASIVTPQVAPVEAPIAAPSATARLASIPTPATDAPLWAVLVLTILLGAAAVVPRRVLIAALVLLLLVAG